MDTRFPNDVSINPLPENPNNNSLIALHENPLHYLLLINKCVAQHEKKNDIKHLGTIIPIFEG
jgi:hypothetical protein